MRLLSQFEIIYGFGYQAHYYIYMSVPVYKNT